MRKTTTRDVEIAVVVRNTQMSATVLADQIRSTLAKRTDSLVLPAATVRVSRVTETHVYDASVGGKRGGKSDEAQE